MSVTVSFPALFSERIGGVESVEMEGDTVEAALRALTEHYTELGSLVWKSLNLNPVLVVFLNGCQLKNSELGVKVRAGDEIMILSPGDIEPFLYLVLGGVIGLIVFVPCMNYMIAKYLDTTMALLTGLMCGSLITLWPWKESYHEGGLSPNLPIGQVIEHFTVVSIFLTFLFFVAGIASSYGLKYMEPQIKI